jgi:hypothetical protein
MAQAAMAKKLQEIDMNKDEGSMYAEYLGRVKNEIAQLRTILEQWEAKSHERCKLYLAFVL